MKKTLLFTTSIFIGILLLTYPETTKGKLNGSPGGQTNSPIDGSNCTGCHNATLNSGQGSVIISSNMLNNEYVPGQTYTITVTASHPSFTNYGFELTAEDQVKAGVFTITNSSQTKLVNGSNAVTHKTSGTLTNTWMVDWTAPSFASSLGTVDFWVCALTANGNGQNSGDEVHTDIYTVTEQQVTPTWDCISPGNCQDPGTGNGQYSSLSACNTACFNTTSIQEKEQLFSVFYSDDKINIDATNTIELINIYNINGQLVKSINSDSKIISTSDLSEGNYIVELSDVLNNKSTTKVNIY